MEKEINVYIEIRTVGAALVFGAIALAFATWNLFFAIVAVLLVPLAIEVKR